MRITPDPRYPIGQFDLPAATSVLERQQWIADIESLPANLRAAVAGLTEPQLDTPYRAGGWTLRQLVHHIADSHMHAYTRMKFALSEDQPVIKGYNEAIWAEFPDARTLPIEVSLALVESLHRRWTLVWRSLTDEQFQRAYQHPESGLVRLDQQLALYSWHSRHHTAHITEARKQFAATA